VIGNCKKKNFPDHAVIIPNKETSVSIFFQISLIFPDFCKFGEKRKSEKCSTIDFRYVNVLAPLKKNQNIFYIIGN